MGWSGRSRRQSEIDSEDREWSWKEGVEFPPSLIDSSGKCRIVGTAEGAGEILSDAADGEAGGGNRALLAVKAGSE